MIQKPFKSNGGQKSYSLYNGEVNMTFREYGHRYEIDGIERVGVTTILKTIIAKEALIGWAVKMMAEYLTANYEVGRTYTAEELTKLIESAKKAHIVSRDKSGEIGTKVHGKIETYIKGKIAGLDMKLDVNSLGVDELDLAEPINAFLTWESENNVVWENTEQPVYSKRYDYCGTLDALALVNNKRTLIDIKTSNYIYPEQYFLQVAAYRIALTEEFPDKKIDDMLIIRVPKTKESKLEVKAVPDYADNAKAFLHGRMLYEQVTKLKNIYKSI